MNDLAWAENAANFDDPVAWLNDSFKGGNFVRVIVNPLLSLSDVEAWDLWGGRWGVVCKVFFISRWLEKCWWNS